MAQQTALEWLAEQLRQLAHNPKTHLGMGDIRVTQGYLDDIEEQAKEMHKAECIAFAESYSEECLTGRYDGDINYLKSVEQYYNETFKK